VKRSIALLQTWWLRLFVLAVLAVTFVVDVPWSAGMAAMALPMLLFLVRPRRSTRDPVDLDPPVRGRWVALNSPGSVVPSHGVRAYGQAYAVDLLLPSDATAKVGWSLRTRRAEEYRTFGEPVLAMAAGTVVTVSDSRRDHRGRDTWPTLLYMMTVEGFVRELGGAPWILGNHVVVGHDDGTYAAYAHLRRASARVREGDRVAAGQEVAVVGNSGNTSEPHLHVQLMDAAVPTAAAGVPMRWPGIAVAEDVDPRWGTGEPKAGALPGFPANGQIFEAASVAGS